MEHRRQYMEELKRQCFWRDLDIKMYRFIKVMDHDFTRQMVFPEEFVKKFREELLGNIGLEGPSGYLWHVELLKVKGNLVFTEGWKEFVEAHHIEEGDYLIFKYEGNSCFSVLIFTTSMCEREAAYFAENPKNSLPKEGGQSKDQEAEDSEESSPKSPSSNKFASFSSGEPGEDKPTPALDKNMACKYVNAASVGHKRKTRTETIWGSLNKIAERHIEKGDSSLHPCENPTYLIQLISSRRPVTDTEKDRASELASAMELANPSFQAVMKTTHVYKRFFLTVPSDFVSLNMNNKRQVVELSIPNGMKRWQVLCTPCRFSVGINGRRWRDFVQENNLEEGDACVFELTSTGKNTSFLVHIFRVVEEITPLKFVKYTPRKRKEARGK